MSRTATITRQTGETEITLALDLNGGDISIDSGLGFFDHMLVSLAAHAGFGMTLRAKGDLRVDGHHTVEDVGIVFGQALLRILGDKAGIARFGQSAVPMDEALASAALDVSGRPFLHWSVPETQERIGSFEACLSEEFWRAVCLNAGITLHITAYGHNAHHISEAVFKACAKALRDAVKVEGTRVPSTKGDVIYAHHPGD